ncbi:MAG: hypothetical protein ACYTXY_42900 [Nostoc sp.]
MAPLPLPQSPQPGKNTQGAALSKLQSLKSGTLGVACFHVRVASRREVVRQATSAALGTSQELSGFK